MTEPAVTVSPDKVDLVQKLWGAGLTSLDIGQEIGLVGEAHQVREAVLRVVEGVKRAVAKAPRPARPRRAAGERSNLPPRQRTAAKEEDVDPMFAVDGFDGSPNEFDLAIPVEQRRSLLGPPQSEFPARAPRECAWPVGDSRHPGFFFCGGSVYQDQHYCAYHHRLSLARYRRAT